MKELLKSAQSQFVDEFDVITKEDLEFITGGTNSSVSGGSGSSSTSGDMCCDCTCVCVCNCPEIKVVDNN